MRDELYKRAEQEFGPVIDRLAAGYEADPDKRRDLKQEIHFQLWRSLERFDGRCELKTWTFRVAHNTAASYVAKERRRNTGLVTLEEFDTATPLSVEANIDRERALARLSELIWRLKPLDRQIMLSYLEEMDAATIADITGLSPANVAMKISRIKNLLAKSFDQERRHA